MAASRADWERARQAVPWLEGGDVAAQLAARVTPETIWRIVSDVYDIAKTDEERAKGQVRIGRRPAREEVPLDEVLATLLPEPYQDKPFREALRELMGSDSQWTFARKVPCDQATLSRLLNGKSEPDRHMLEALAAAGGKGPWWFVEWRAMFMADLVRAMFMRHPHKSAQAMRLIVQRRRRP